MNTSLVQAIRGCGMKVATDPGKHHGLALTVDRHPVAVAVKAVTDDERVEKWPGALAQIMLRVDVPACERLGLETGRDLDRWIMRVEECLGALVVMVDGYHPPFPGHRLALQHVTPGDPWALHLATSKDGRWRESKHFVMQAGA